ncbi:hypothetical protein [Pseudoduganella lutea]|uniref:Uncharacterized protein n=1 Tax=Pseudoduganella lutea TaxID=321985 RepID=A0A4P6L3B6_9BURK|nr:hypothetical protein [Pseudoduganella lutea]QBE65775.1 hypothetical protein EWM63_24660 [Pseudoduganella lutea]
MHITLVTGNPATHFGLDLDHAANGNAMLRLRAPGGAKVEVMLAWPVTVPERLLVTQSGAKRLATLAEVRAIAAREVSQQTQELEAQWQALVNRLSSASLHANMAQRFLGLVPFPAGSLDYVGTVKLNLNVCMLDSQAGLEAIIEVAATSGIMQAGIAVQARTAWRLTVLATSPIPRLNLQVPVPALRFPEFEFPNFDLSALSMPAPKDYPFDLPTLPGIPLTVAHTGVTLSNLVYTPAAGALTFSVTINNATVSVFGGNCVLGSPTLSFDSGVVTIAGFSARPDVIEWAARPAAALPSPLGGVSLALGAGSLQLAFEVDANVGALKGVLIQNLTVFPTLQPTKKLELRLQLPFDDSGFVPTVTINNAPPIPREIELGIQGGTVSLTGLLQSLSLPGSISLNLDLDLPSLPAPQLDTLVDILSAILGALVKGLAGLARIVESGLRALFSLLRKAAEALSRLDVTLVLDQRSGHLQQVLVGMRRAGTGVKPLFDTSTLAVSAPADIELALLIDLRDGERNAYLVATVDAAQQELLTMSSDLWFGGGDKESEAAAVEAPGAASAGKPAPKLIRIEVKTRPEAAGRFSFVPFGIRQGQAVFFYALETPLPDFETAPTVAFGGYRLTDKLDGMLDVDARFDLDLAKQRFLPFLAAPAEEPAADGGGLGDMLKQYIQIDDMKPAKLQDGFITSEATVTLKAMGSKVKSNLTIELDARRLTANVRGGAIKISVPDNEPLELLGMKASFINKSDPNVPVTGDQFVLDMTGADTRMYLNDALTMVLDLTSLGKDAEGKPLRFHVSKLVVHGGGLDLEASLAAPYTLRLNGLETDFKFNKAAIRVQGGRIEAFSLSAQGKLPPALVGDVDVKLTLDFGTRKNGSVGLLNGAIDLLGRGKPIRNEQTSFVFTLEALSIRVFDDGGGLHFCAFISGSALFQPEASELANGMLKKLAGVELKFTDCPVCGASDVIARELEKLNLSFVVALDEPAKATLFGMFTFEVRCIGLEPRCRAFSDRPAAIVIGGQISFAATGDVVRAECDFHKLFIATPEKGGFLPRVACEGLGLALRLGSALEVEGKVVAVDGDMPNLLVSKAPATRIPGKGFIGQGRVAIQGLPPIAASFGFVELEFPNGERKRAWFVYLEAQRLSYYFQLGPVPIYLREAGLGLGFHFTYVGIEEIDSATSLTEMIKGVDRIAATALEPARYESWITSRRGDLTLVARLFISMSSASAPAEPLVWKKDEEKDLPNVMLLNVVAAMRKSTFLMTANIWLGYNYHDWDAGRHLTSNDLAGKQALTGYVLLAGARSEFLARVKSNPGAKIGDRLALPEQFKNALSEVQYEATLYIRPGLLHFELGWPNRITWSKNFAGVNVSVAGGAIFRIHEGAVLAGLNLEGNLDFSMSARLDAGVVGVAVSASVSAALIARIIGFLDSRNVGNSLYYSLFSLQVQVKFEVSAWLEIDAWLCKITIRVSFALQLQIDVVAELALQGDLQMGTRVRATIAVSIFGRSLGLSVGLSINPGLVDNASARVGRFMNLGLMQEVPSVTPDIGQQDAANDAASSIGAERREARAVAGAVNLPGDHTLAPVPHQDPLSGQPARPIVEGLAIGPTDFQIVLTYPKVQPAAIGNPLPKLEQWVYLTFLPLDARPAVKGGKQRSSFYAAPHADEANKAPDHVAAFPDSAVGHTCYVFSGGSWRPHTFAAGHLEVASNIEWSRELGYSQSTEDSAGVPADKAGRANLKQLFFAAFRTMAGNVGEASLAKPYLEPSARPPIMEGARIVRSARTTQEQHDRQEHGYNRNIAANPADRRCHEARDFLMQKFVSDLFQLAADGSVTDEAHVAHVGLTMLVPLELARLLSVPQGARPTVRKRIEDPAVDGTSAACEMFNAPHLRFSVKPPSFVNPDCRLEDNKARLDWDLQWDHEIEPEYFVKHYKLRRWIEVDGEQRGEAKNITFKRADRVVQEADASRRTVERCSWQYTDEFGDMSEGDKKFLFDRSRNAVLRYSVTAVCVSDTLSRPCSDFMAQRIGMPQLTPITRASAIMQVDPLPDPKTGKLKAPELLLRLETGADVVAPGDVRFWRLLLRSEAIVPVGEYGTDGHTDRALGGAIGGARTARRGDLIFEWPANNDLQFPAPTGAGQEDRHAPVNDPALIAHLADTADPRAWTLLAQRFVKRNRVEIAASPLVPVELGLVVMAANGAQQNLMTRVDALEMVRMPLAEEEHLLDPVARRDLHVLPGRAAFREPRCGLDYSSVVHPDFGGVTKLSWNLRPSGIGAAALARHRLLAGFEVVSLNLDSGARADDPAQWKSGRVQRHTLARLLETEGAPLTPSQVGEPSNWKVRYPSQAGRRLAGGVWYSPAESRIVWPWPDIRREPLPEPSSELIKALLREGAPDHIELAMTGGTGIVWKFSLDPHQESPWRLNAEGTRLLCRAPGRADVASGLRAALRRLRAEPSGAESANGYGLALKRGWSLQMTPRWLEVPDSASLHETVAMNFERELHPLLEALLARMRRLEETGSNRERLLDLDRRPAPVVQADNVHQFLAVTEEAFDPYGWAMLDRLGLGVTVRLYDPVDDVFLSARRLHDQLALALKDDALAKLYTASLPQLMVEVLLQPGGMMEREEFSTVPDALGEMSRHTGQFLLQDEGLAMVRLSLRPSIKPELQYVVWDRPSNEASDQALTGVDVYIPQLVRSDRIDGISLRTFIARLESGSAGRRAPTVILRTRADASFHGELDRRPGVGALRGGSVDAFGRFEDWTGWDDQTDPGRHRFLTYLLSALGPDYKPQDGEDKAVTDKWRELNRRFFVYAADPAAPAGRGAALAFAAVEPSEPMQVSGDSAGRLSIMLPEADGYARTRAFAVLPQWRYARMLRDAGHGAPLDALLKHKREEGIVDPSPKKQHRYVISTIERTAPMQPPEVLTVGRLGDSVWWTDGKAWEREGAPRSAEQLREAAFSRAGTDPGEYLPVVVRHHSELRLSKSNAMPARALSVAGSLTSFVLTPSDQAWCEQFVKLGVLEPVQRDSREFTSRVDAEVLGEITRLLGDPPADSKVRVLRHLPHWYRHGVSLSAAAGSAVAETVTTWLPDAPARLVQVSGTLAEPKDGHPWKGLVVPPLPIIATGEVKYPHLALELPALRYCDTTDEVTAQLWDGDIARVPDPGVMYELVLEAEGNVLCPRAAHTALARIGRAPAPAGHPFVTTFLLSPEWTVDAALVPDQAAPILRVSVSPLGSPVALDQALALSLAPDPWLRGATLRLPGGWSARWVEHYAARLDDLTPLALLFKALAEAEMGAADGPAEVAKLFPSYALATVRLVQPGDDAGWEALAKVVGDWVAALAVADGTLAKLLHARFAPVAAALALKTWPADDPSGEALAWLDTLPEPGQGCGWTLQGAPRMLIPDLMTDDEYTAVAGAIAGAPPELAQRFALLRAAQRERALAGAKLRIRATRGDAIALALALISLT